MTARQMFENLGYKQVRNDSCLIKYEQFINGNCTQITFTLLLKKVIATYGYQTSGSYAHDITSDEFRAIVQQEKELGWLEEETYTNKTYKKPTYKLTQCEYDMLDTIFEKEARFSTVYFIGELKKKGYFKNIKCDSKVRVKDILANCEVVG